MYLPVPFLGHFAITFTRLLEEVVCYDLCVLLAKLYQPLPCFILYSKAKFACYSSISLLPTFAFQSLIMKMTSFLGVIQRVLLLFIEPFNFSLFRAQTWITVILNGLPWKRIEIILSFLRLHPSTAFWTLLLTMMATPFLLRDSCPQSQI